jgi:hypothetical protein
MTAPVTVVDATFALVRVYVNVVVLGTEVIEYVPSKGLPIPATTIEFATASPCAVEEVSLATLEVSDASVIAIPRRISLAPPPPAPGAVPEAPPFQPPVAPLFIPPTKKNNTSPGVTGKMAST